MKKHYLLVSPRIAWQKGDFLGSGVPYWPMELAVFASFLRQHNAEVRVIDRFGLAPNELEDKGTYYLQGARSLDLSLAHPSQTPAAIILYALSYMSLSEILSLIPWFRKRYPATPIAILENAQAVTAFSINDVASQFFSAGANFLICGEPYHNWDQVEFFFSDPHHNEVPENVVSSLAPDKKVKRLSSKSFRYPHAAWDLFPYKNYWKLPYSHGPKWGRYFPILTSRGCPYGCDFCVLPELSTRQWSARGALDVVDEMESLQKKFKVNYFQVEDVNPTVRKERWITVAEEIIQRRMKIKFGFVSGTKAETIPLESLPILKKAGLDYISISPETGSKTLLKTIGKPFDYDFALKLVRECYRLNIKTQACFIVGHPSETEEDFQESLNYLKRLLKQGLDEVAIFVIAPFAGSQLFKKSKIALSNQAQLVSFSPKGRPDYPQIEERRRTLIRAFFVYKLARPHVLILHAYRSCLGRPRLKIENLPRRVGYVVWLLLWFHLMRWLTKLSLVKVHQDSAPAEAV